MQKETYEKMQRPFLQHPSWAKGIILSDVVITRLVYVLYPLYLCYLMLNQSYLWLPSILVPGLSFLAVSFFRQLYSAKRPYEVFDLPVLLNKETKGKSFPSRHVFSIYMVGMTIYQGFPLVGMIIGILGIFLAGVRVIGGVHFLKDVIAGAFLGMSMGWLGFFIMNDWFSIR